MDNNFELSFEDERFKQAEALLLAALSELDRLCNHEGISYALYFDALAAAVSQRRLWPGTDNVSLIFPRSDYRKFLTILASPRLNERFYLELPGGVEASVRCHARLCLKGTQVLREGQDLLCHGPNPLAIDLLPMEYVAKSEMKQAARLKRILAWSAALKLKSGSVESVSELEQAKREVETVLPKSGLDVFFKSLFPNRWAYKRREQLMRGRKDEEPQRFALYLPHAGLEAVSYGLYQHIFPAASIPLASKAFSCPGKAHEVLRELYGDYRYQFETEKKTRTYQYFDIDPQFWADVIWANDPTAVL